MVSGCSGKKTPKNSVIITFSTESNNNKKIQFLFSTISAYHKHNNQLLTSLVINLKGFRKNK